MNIRILTNNLKGYYKDQILDLRQFDGTPMEAFWRTRLSENDGICELVVEDDNTNEVKSNG